MTARDARITHTVEQQSPEWFALRCGKITGSDAQGLLAKQGAGAMHQKIVDRVASEIVTGLPAESYKNGYMERGNRQEPEALAKYALVRGCDPLRIGFIEWKRRRIGCSPDALVGTNKVVQIKTQAAHLLVDTFRKNEFPSEHIRQTQFELWVAERDVTEIAIFAPGMPLFHKEMGRDERLIRQLSDAVDRAYEEIDLLVQRIKGWSHL